MSTVLEILDKLRESATSERDKGDRLERLIQAFLRRDPVWAEQFANVWLWRDWPGREGRPDTGIDLVAADRLTGGLVAIQCKFYSPTLVIKKGDIDSFLAVSGQQGFAERIIVSTTAKWGKNALDAIKGQQIPVRLLEIADLEKAAIDWSVFDPDRPDRLELVPKKELRPHQARAVNDVSAGFLTRDRGKLIMACGTGKTLTALRLAEQLVGKGGQVLLLVPSISLLSQTLREWSNDASVPLSKLAVCSDPRVSSRRKSDDEDISLIDLALPATTDTDLLVKRWGAARDDAKTMTVVFATYQSIEVVAAAQKAGAFGPFDLIVCDEAHRTTGATLAGDDESAFVRVHNDEYLPAARRMYMTATPRIYDDASKAKAGQASAVLASMDDENVFGPEFHRLSFGEAVAQDLLTDYKVLVLAVSERAVATEFQKQLADDGDLNLDDVARIVGCWNGLAKRGDHDDAFSDDPERMRRAVAFAGTIAASKRVEQLFERVAPRYAANHEQGGRGDSLWCSVVHVDGTSSALDRNAKLDWLSDEVPTGECRILTNARCLSEGVDVPALDAVMFLSPRRSTVDIVQSVGRVMRKAPGKKYGYIILPIGVPDGVSPEKALNDNKRYAVVWEVLQALRAHDDRFNAMVNRIDLTSGRPPEITVIGVPEPDWTQGTFDFTYPVEELRKAIFAKLVSKVGTRRYWEKWAEDVADIAQRHITRINALLGAGGAPNVRQQFDSFLDGLRGNLNESITAEDAVEMLAQHLITRPVFDALFADYEFTKHNAVAQSMERMLAVLDQHALDDENSTLEQFYESVRMRIQGIDTAEGRQKIVIELYDTFFKTAFKRTVERLGIVYTPVEVVDFILRSADAVLKKHFGQSLTHENVHILDGFAGTGTFVVRLLQLGLIESNDLVRKYREEIHANEILLLAYYIAAVNIESAFHDVRRQTDVDAPYEPFPGLILTDTFQSYEEGDRSDLLVLPENNERIARQRALAITAIVGNPPYSAGQASANDNNANTVYPGIDAAIRESYAARSTAVNKNSLYDSYIRAIKWATLRIRGRGVIAFVTNGGFLDANTADGLRLSLVDDFTDIYVYNLKGNQRTAGERSRREGGKIFEGGSRATIAISILVRDPSSEGPAQVHYADIGDYLSRSEKLAKLNKVASITQVDDGTLIAPNRHGDWLGARSEEFTRFLPLATTTRASGIFEAAGPGIQTNRDAWVYNFDPRQLVANMARAVDAYQKALEGNRTNDPRAIKWSGSLEQRLARQEPIALVDGEPIVAMYRPFQRTFLYPDIRWMHRPGPALRLFPSPRHTNFGFYALDPASSKPFSVLATSCPLDVALYGSNAGQYYARWRWEPDEAMALTFTESPEETSTIDGLRRRDNISGSALAAFQAVYGPSFNADDVFFYCYGLLHSPDYRSRFEADLRRVLPRVPLVKDPGSFIQAGRLLCAIHRDYETVVPFPLDGMPAPDAELRTLKVAKMGVISVRRDGRPVPDLSTIVYNSEIRLDGIPEDTYRYTLGAKSAIQWVLERYQVRTDTLTGIVNDPNSWAEAIGEPRYILDLVCRVVTVSLETMRIVDSLPPLDILPDQPKLK